MSIRNLKNCWHRCICIILALVIVFVPGSFSYGIGFDGDDSRNLNQIRIDADAIASDVSTIKTALSTLYTYLSNNGNGVREGILAIYNQFQTANTKLYNINEILDSNYIGLQAVANYLYTISNNVSGVNNHIDAVGGQVADVSSKLLVTNSTLASISSQIAALDLPDDFDYSIFYYDNIVPVNSYFEQFTTNRVTHDYPFDMDSGVLQFFRPVIKTEYLDGNKITVYFPVPNGDYTITIPDNYETTVVGSHDGITYESITFQSLNASIEYGDNFLAITMYFPQSYSEYEYISCGFVRTASGLTNNLLQGLTPYIIRDQNMSLSYFARYKDQYDEIIQLLKSTSGTVVDNNNVVVAVDLDVDVGDGLSRIINKVKHLFDTGISLQQTILVLDVFDNLPWFSSWCYQMVNNNSSQYTDIYD